MHSYNFDCCFVCVKRDPSHYGSNTDWVFDSGVIRRIFESEKDEVTGRWRICIMRSFIILYSTLNYQTNKYELGRAYSTDVYMRSAYIILVEISLGKSPLGRSRRRCEDNLKMDLTEIGWECVDWIYLAEHRDRWRSFVNTVMNLEVPWMVRDFLTTVT
jgi:hypothetical protein